MCKDQTKFQRQTIGKQNWNIRSVSEVALFSHEAGRYFILNFGIYCSFQSWWGRYFLKFLFYLEIVNKMRQASNTISEVTHSIKKPCGRCDIKFIWQFTALSFQILSNLYWKMWKTLVQACKMLKSLSKRPWGSRKEIFFNLILLSLPDERGENKICQFLSFSVYFWKFWLRQGGLSFYGSRKGDKGADTDLMFQFCLPYDEK